MWIFEFQQLNPTFGSLKPWDEKKDLKMLHGCLTVFWKSKAIMLKVFLNNIDKKNGLQG